MRLFDKEKTKHKPAYTHIYVDKGLVVISEWKEIELSEEEELSNLKDKCIEELRKNKFRQ
jgi:hypothetical protein